MVVGVKNVTTCMIISSAVVNMSVREMKHAEQAGISWFSLIQ